VTDLPQAIAIDDKRRRTRQNDLHANHITPPGNGAWQSACQWQTVAHRLSIWLSLAKIRSVAATPENPAPDPDRGQRILSFASFSFRRFADHSQNQDLAARNARQPRSSPDLKKPPYNSSPLLCSGLLRGMACRPGLQTVWKTLPTSSQGRIAKYRAPLSVHAYTVTVTLTFTVTGTGENPKV